MTALLFRGRWRETGLRPFEENALTVNNSSTQFSFSKKVSPTSIVCVCVCVWVYWCFYKALKLGLDVRYVV